MKTVRRITSWILAAAMLGCSVLPAGEVEAKQNADYQKMQIAGYGDTQTEKPETTETPATEVPTTQETTTETPTTEEPEQVVNPDLYMSQLSPATAKVVVLDPGHCGKHPGAYGNGLREEAVVLDIAKVCQKALDKYGDITVYMTREDGSCCRELELGDCLVSRNNYAKRLNADFLISLHINAGRTNGANVLAAYESGYNDEIRKETQAFGKIALSKLSSIGIKNRGYLLRKSEAGNRYKNGKLTDYYSIVRNGVLQRIPSVIIEHGYISSSSDCSKFFKTKSKRTKVGNADAKAVVSYYGLKKKIITGTFTKKEGATYYQVSGNKKAAGWIKDDGQWYYFDPSNGKMQKGFLTIGEDTFYLSPSTGKMLVGWFTVDGTRYLARGNGTIVKNQPYSDGMHTYLFDAKGGQLKKGFHSINGLTYYANSKRYAVSGIQKINGKYYGFDPQTKQMLYGYQKINGKYYYLNKETGAALRNGIAAIKGSRYYFSSSGVRKTGWVKYKGDRYYFNKSSGKMTTGWRKVNRKYYYFDKENGRMQKSKWIGRYYVNYKGVRSKKK